MLSPDLGDPIDLLVIAIDVDIAIDAGISDPPMRVGFYETKRLREQMTAWLIQASSRGSLPSAVVLSTPVMAIEAWIIAALFPKQRSPEKLQDPAEALVARKKLRRSVRDGKAWKEFHIYRDTFAPVVAKRLKRVRKACAEVERTLRAVEQRRLELDG